MLRKSALPLAFVVALGGPAQAAVGAATDESTERVAPLLKEAQAEAGTPKGMVALEKMYELKSRLDELQPLAEGFEWVASNRHALPEVAALARFFDADIERARGREVLAGEHTVRLGFLTHFQLIGSFDNEGKAGFDRVFPPETEIDLAKAYPGKARDVHWRPFELVGPDGYLEVGSAVRPTADSVVYALTQLDVAKDTRVVLHLGAGGASKLFVDGQKVLEDPAYHAPFFDQHAVAVTLRKGSHRLLLKLCHTDGGLGFYLRVSGARNEPLPAVTSRLPDPALAPPHGKLEVEAIPPITDALEKALRAPGGDTAENHEVLAQVLALTHLADRTDHRPAQESARAATLAPHDADVLLTAAELAEDDGNLRRANLEAAAVAAPTRPEPQLELARDDLARGHPDRAQARLKTLLATADTVEAQLLLARAEDDLGDFPAAHERVERVLRAHPRAVEAIKEASRQDRRLDRERESMGHLRVALSLRYDDAETRRALVLALIDLGQLDDALREQEKLLTLDPTDASTWARRGELLAFNGRGAEARAVFARALAIDPEDDGLWEREGRALLALDDATGARQAFEAALALRPQNPQLKEALQALRGDQPGFGESLAAEAPTLLREHAPTPGEDTEILNELVAVKVNPNGTSSRLVQLVARANTERGVDDLRSRAINYSPDRQEVSVLRTRIFHRDGSVAEAHSESEQGLSEPWAGIYYDARVRVVSFPNLQPGDAIELMYRVEDAARDNLLGDYFGDLEMLQSDAPEDHVTYVLSAPAARPIYSKVTKLTAAEVKDAVQPDGTHLYRWDFTHVPKIVAEPRMPGYGEVSGALHVSTYRDWAAVGRFYWGMVRDQLVPTDEVKKAALEIAKGIDPADDAAKVAAVYDFVVTRTRYVGLEFGIHGFKPYAVDRILTRGFGDCKDKASLMHALLEELGVPSNLTLLRMRRLGDVDPEPASLAIFNHAILYVPKLDRFLDGTAEYYGSHELPDEDQGAMVLVIQPDGSSKLGHAPEETSADNVTQSSYEITLQRDGSGLVKAQSSIAGLNAPEYRRAYATPATRRAVFEEAWSRTFPGLRVQRLEVGDLTQLEKPVHLEFELEVPHYGDSGPGGLILSPFGKSASYVEGFAALSHRQYDVVEGFPWENRFRYVYRLPADLRVHELPPPVDVSTPFGHVALACVPEASTVRCDGQVSLTRSRVPVGEYGAYRVFLQQVDQVLSRKILLEPAPAAASAPRAEAHAG